MSMSKNGLGNTGITHKLNFAVGQLAAASIGMKGHKHDGYIGRIDSIDDLGNVVLRTYDDELVNVTLDNLKQCVHYDNERPHYLVEGFRAEVFGLDHPAPYIGPNQPIYTSTVLMHNTTTGFFETRNTVYQPKTVKFWDGEVMTSPYLKS